VVKSFSKGSIMSFPRLYAVVTMETVQKRGSYLILIVVAAGFSSFLGGGFR